MPRRKVKKRRRKPQARRKRWAHWPDERLLQLRFKDLKLSMRGTWLADCLRELNRELAGHGIPVRPHAWLSTEWFSPEHTPGIAIPFYLAHPRLMRLRSGEHTSELQ